MPPKSLKPLKTLEEEQLEEKRMQEVLLLLEHLTKSQDATIKMILDCLYDVGAVNLINQKVSYRPLNGLAKNVAGMSKPAFRFFALRWFQKNCPQLITKWLHSKIAFKKPTPKAKKAKVVTIQSPPPVAENTVEIKRLRSQVRYLTGVSVSAIAALAGVIVWWGYLPRLESASLPSQPQATEVKE